VCTDAEAGRVTADETFARYGTLENYQRLFQREGVTSPGRLAVVGSESEVDKQLRRFADAGATELWPTVFPVGEDADASVRRTRALLADLAAES
jgi:alkanesulfonate monooxygenase SsuD/methylene tetrahydromethanopterin reductase-like flavin-dependent oxidoreductase (luciferase family)